MCSISPRDFQFVANTILVPSLIRSCSFIRATSFPTSRFLRRPTSCPLSLPLSPPPRSGCPAYSVPTPQAVPSDACARGRGNVLGERECERDGVQWRDRGVRECRSLVRDCRRHRRCRPDGQVLSGSRPAPGLGVPFEGAAGERLEGDRGRPPRVRYESLCREGGPHTRRLTAGWWHPSLEKEAEEREDEGITATSSCNNLFRLGSLSSLFDTESGPFFFFSSSSSSSSSSTSTSSSSSSSSFSSSFSFSLFFSSSSASFAALSCPCPPPLSLSLSLFL